MYEKLKNEVCLANQLLAHYNLAILSWGNVSGIDRKTGIIAIKPSGVAYNQLTAEKIVLVDLDGQVVDSDLKPSSDTPTHLELYRSFTAISGICHTHSHYATIWAQACKKIPCLGTTHADFCHGSVPVTESMTKNEIETDYELNTGKCIVRRFAELDSTEYPAVLVANHGPFTWADSAHKAIENAVILEEVAALAMGTMQLNPKVEAIDQSLLDKHFLRKHGNQAYYGQKSVNFSASK